MAFKSAQHVQNTAQARRIEMFIFDALVDANRLAYALTSGDRVGAAGNVVVIEYIIRGSVFQGAGHGYATHGDFADHGLYQHLVPFVAEDGNHVFNGLAQLRRILCGYMQHALKSPGHGLVAAILATG